MTRRSSVLAAAALAALSFVTANASADAGGTVTLGQFSYTLTNLDPNDGITPSITFLPAPTTGASAGAGMLLFEYSAGKMSQSPYVDGAGKQPVSADYVAQGLSIGGSLNGTVSLDTASLSLHASADQSSGQEVSAWATANSRRVDFILSPNTALTVQANVHFSGAITAGGDLNRLDMDGDIWLTGEDANGDPVSQYFTTDTGFLSGPTPAFDRIASLVGSYSNASAASFDGSLLLYATVDALSVPSATTSPGLPAPVPEPANLAMLAAGLPLLLALRRRARHKAQT